MTIERAWLPGGVGAGIGKKRFSGKQSKVSNERNRFPTLAFLTAPSIKLRTCLAREYSCAPSPKRHSPSKNLREPRKFVAIAIHTFPQTGLGKRGSPGGEQPQPKKIGTVHHEGHEGHEVRSLRERGHSCPRILAGSLDGAPSAPYTRRLIFGLYDKHVGF